MLPLPWKMISNAGEVFNQSFANGIVYWNESMPPLGQVLNYSTLLANRQLIGWVTTVLYFIMVIRREDILAPLQPILPWPLITITICSLSG